MSRRYRVWDYTHTKTFQQPSHKQKGGILQEYQSIYHEKRIKSIW